MRDAYTLHFVADDVLKDGTPVVVRAVQPDDKPLLAAGFERLSPNSRYRRFLHHKARLSEDELKYLTELDGVDHYALGILVKGPDGGFVPAGIGRIVRGGLGPLTTEMALVIMDEFQRRGVGRSLVRHLTEAARERGIRSIRFTLLSDNDPMRNLIKAELGEFRLVERDGPVLTVEVDVAPRYEHPLRHLRRATALGWSSQLRRLEGARSLLERR